jgi:preprotein translocase subunit YajC
MFVSPAYAQGAALPGGGGFESLLPLVLIFAVFYFLLIRPQQKKMKQHRESLDSIRRGDKIVLGGGIMGTVTKIVSDTELLVEIAEGVRVRVQRGLVSTVISKTQPVDGEGKPLKPAEGEAQPGGVMSGLKGLFGGGKK